MKKLLFIFGVTLFIVACTGIKKDKSTDEEAGMETANTELVTYQYKIDGLQDSIVSDSIWRIIFQMDGVDKLIISRDDSTAIFTVDPELVTNEILEKEIESRGGKLLN